VTYTIRKMQSRDLEPLAELFPHKREGRFEDYYLEHLQGQRLLFVAYEVPEESEPIYYGYVTLQWESQYTQFWRRNIPEITDLNVAKTHRKQGVGSALIAACEAAARKAGFSIIGISVVQSEEYEAANRLYPALGYEPDGHGITPDDDELHLVKKLPRSS
jgi:GNAT superfamily N-acetyltransferase